MSFASPITRQTVGKTFTVGISVLGVGALLQLSAIGWIFYSRFRTTPLPTANATVEGSNATRSFDDPFVEDEPGSGGMPTVTAVPAKPAPTAQFPYKPVPITLEQASAPAPVQPESRFTELIEQARTLRERGDTSTAITRFREALALDPQNPLPLAEIATTFEKVGAADKAAEHWRRIYDMGEAAGVYYTAAEAKMKASQAQAILQTMPKTTPQDLAVAAEATRQPAPATESAATVPGSKLGLGDVTRRDEVDPSALQKFTLRVPIRAKPRARIDVRDVTIQVLFYDVINGRTLDKTNAQVSTRWANPPGDWGDDDVETLEVTYTQQPPEQGEPMENRKFYGYIVRIYYKDALLDTRAEPARLNQTFPAPRTLQTDSTP
ncbi:tetratricopeptide repeat protein [Verrucomicrobiota bacterium sgz303538]